MGVKSPFQANAGQPQRTALSHLALGCAPTCHSLGFHPDHMLTPDPVHKLSSDSSPTLSPDHAHKPTGQNQSGGLASAGMGQGSRGNAVLPGLKERRTGTLLRGCACEPKELSALRNLALIHRQGYNPGCGL